LTKNNAIPSTITIANGSHFLFKLKYLDKNREVRGKEEERFESFYTIVLKPLKSLKPSQTLPNLFPTFAGL